MGKSGKNEAGAQIGMPAHKTTCGANPTLDHAASQCARLLDALRRRSLTTLQCRSELMILHPAARVQDLREVGQLCAR